MMVKCFARAPTQWAIPTSAVLKMLSCRFLTGDEVVDVITQYRSFGKRYVTKQQRAYALAGLASVVIPRSNCISAVQLYPEGNGLADRSLLQPQGMNDCAIRSVLPRGSQHAELGHLCAPVRFG
jgi:hypothetical protein